MKPSIKRAIRWTAIGLGVVVTGVVTWALVTIGPSNVWGMLRYDTRKEGTLTVGDRAPDVSLLALDGKTRVHLSERMGDRPLVVIFGSYT
ncbi:MAG: hypothetical protein ABJC13_07915 [Acidobacteriota bacterium]